MKLLLCIDARGESKSVICDVNEQPLVLGRAWDADIRVDDKYVDAHHVSLVQNEDGQLELREFGTVNGTKLNDQLLQKNSVPISVGDTFVIGDTRIRLVDPSESVVPAVPRSVWYRMLNYFDTTISVVALTLVVMLIDSAVAWSSSVAEFKPHDLGAQWVQLLASGLITVLLMGLVSRLVKKETNIKGHWVFLMLVFLVLNVFALFFPIVEFNWSNPELSELIRTIAFALVAWVFIVAFMSYSTNLGLVARSFWGVLMALVVVSSTYLEDWNREPYQLWSDQANQGLVTLPPSFLWVRPTSMEEYSQETEALFEQVLSD